MFFVVVSCFALHYFLTIIIMTTIHFMLAKRETYYQIFCMFAQMEEVTIKLTFTLIIILKSHRKCCLISNSELLTVKKELLVIYSSQE